MTTILEMSEESEAREIAVGFKTHTISRPSSIATMKIDTQNATTEEFQVVLAAELLKVSVTDLKNALPEKFI